MPDRGVIRPLVVIVMGVTGTGKSTVARLLADHLSWPMAEGDDFHSAANIAKMHAGHPLTDADRWPWLQTIGAWIADRETARSGGLVTCSALKRTYRDLLRDGHPDVRFVCLAGSHELLAARLAQRVGHFMPATLLDSQLATLEPLQSDEPGVTIDVAQTPQQIVVAALAAIAEWSDSATAGVSPDASPDGGAEQVPNAVGDGSGQHA